MNPIARNSMLFGAAVATACVVASCTASSGASSGAGDPSGVSVVGLSPSGPRGATGLPLPSTRAERTNYQETSLYADVITFVDSLVLMKAPITVLELGKSPAGKTLPLIIASRPKVATPADARRLNRPVVYVQANIHAGEVEGKEAVMALLREWSFGATPNVLDSLVVIVVPIYNADGNDKLAENARNRGAQNGPALIGERPNGMGLDLNRDYMKAEAPETQGSLRAFNAWDPDVFMDLHTTNGSYHGYALTYSPSLHPAAPLALYTADTLLPEIRKRMRDRHQFEVFPYGNFSGANGRGEGMTATEKSGWWTYEHKPRYGSNYYGLRGRISILSEAYSHDPLSRRVASTHAFVQEVLSFVAERPADIKAHVAAGVARATFTAGNTSPVAIKAAFTTKPDTQAVLVEVLERYADSSYVEAPGVARGIKRTGRMVERRMPVVDRFDATLTQVPTLYGYVFDSSWVDAIRQLKEHGISVTRLDKPMTATMQVFHIDSVAFAARPFQGHKEATVTGSWRDTTRVIPAGTMMVSAATSRDLLAMMLLEPESDDGLLTWNSFDAGLVKGKVAPVGRLTAPLRVYSPGNSADNRNR
jgi:hypothetical protein